MFNYKIYVLSLLIIGILSINLVNAETKEKILENKIIYLDPGHGGKDPGAVYKQLEEDDINLLIAEKLKMQLENLGATVYMTRYGDYDLAVPYVLERKRSDLSRRVNIINKSMCDLYLSIHLNSENSSLWQGAQVFYDDINDENIKLAQVMQKELRSYLKTRRSYERITTMYIHRRIERPGILIEVGFLSNPSDRYLLTKKYYQERIARVISSGVVKYFSQQ